jgi:LacI family transcriptional regulator
VLNDNPNVDPELRERVRQSIATLGYQPNALACGLRRQATRTIGLIVPDNRNPFFAEIAMWIEEYCYGVGYNVYLCNSADDDAKELEYCQNLYRQRVAGVIMSITGTTPEGIHYLQVRRMPVVLLDRSYPNVEADSVQCDHYQGARQAAEYLIGLGHRHLGLVVGPRRHPPVRDRLQAVTDVFAEHGCRLDPHCIYETRSYEHEEGYQGADCLLSKQPHMTAIFAFNDMLAIGVLRYALEHGIQVPGDLSIVGVDNIPLSSFVTPRLTTIAQPMADIGRIAAQLLLERAQDMSKASTRRLLPPQLIIRESTGKAVTGA